MRPLRIIRSILIAMPLFAACSGAGEHAASSDPAKADTLRNKIWTPQQARAAREAREHPATAPAENVAPTPAPAPQEDSATWARAESLKFEQRKRSMGGYASCIAQANGVTEPVRTTILNACKHAPGAPR